MATKPPPGLLSRPAPVAAALLGLALLDDVGAAAAHLTDGDDPEALHDFRVALRRVRTLLRLFRAELGDAAAKKVQRRLRNVTRLTSAGRDAEVQLAWIRAHQAEIGRGSRAGLRWLLARIGARREAAYVNAHDEVTPELRQVERRLRRGFVEVRDAPASRRGLFATAAARAIRAQAAALEGELGTARSPDQDAIHNARIAVKRLRYLLEWLNGDLPQATPIVARLRDLQDLLGELNDVHVLIRELGDATAEAAAERARSLHARALRRSPHRRATRGSPAPGSAGLLALARLAGRTERDLVRRLVADGDGVGPRALVAEVTTLAGQLLEASRAALPRAPRGLRLRPRRRAAV